MRETDILEELQALDEYVAILTAIVSFSSLRILTLSRTLRGFPTEAHWFCPRRTEDDEVDYDNLQEPEDGSTDLDPAAKRELIEEGKHRQDIAYKYSIVLGLDPNVAGRMLSDYAKRMHELLSTCSTCIRNYHMGRKAYLKHLREYVKDLPTQVIC
jgi:senataxin